MRPISSMFLTVAVVSLGACTTRSEAGAGAEGPPLPLVTAAAPVPPSADPGPAQPQPQPDPPPAERSAEASPSPPESGVSEHALCPGKMVLVDGDYCTDVRQECIEWVDPPETKLARCAKFAPSVCAGARVHKRFCVDADEYVPPGQSLPLSDASWVQARRVCERQSKRLCRETEWEFACEGEQMLPYPTGYARDSVACNFDKSNLVDPATGKLRDQREPPSALDRCTSPFGVRNMSGNVDEWVWRDRTRGEWRSALKGGWWMPARDRCRPATTAHGENFHELQTGVRCCADAV
jgi:formylglycine-generating enzyme